MTITDNSCRLKEASRGDLLRAGALMRLGGQPSCKPVSAWRAVPLLVALSCGAAADAESPVVTSTDKGGVEFQVAESELAPNDIQVFNGVSPTSGRWDAVLIAAANNAEDMPAGGACTAAMIGRNVLLTAAHCVMPKGNRPQPIVLKLGTWALTFECSVDDVYRDQPHNGRSPRHPADYALCAIEPLARRPTQLETAGFEWIDLGPLATTAALLVAGYGCVTWSRDPATGNLAFGPPRQILAVGDMRVDAQAPSGDAFSSSSDATTQSALCAGDSGGPAYSGASTANLNAPRAIRGVASRLDPVGQRVKSTFASLSSPRFRQFLRCWMGKYPNSGIQIRPVLGPAVTPLQC